MWQHHETDPGVIRVDPKALTITQRTRVARQYFDRTGTKHILQEDNLDVVTMGDLQVD